MKKVAMVLLATITCCTVFTGYNNAVTEQPLAVYSFHGENEQFSISNGVLVFNDTEEVLYGGFLEEKQGLSPNIAECSMTFYTMSANGKKTWLSNAAKDMTGGTVNISGEVGKISGDIFRESEIDEVKNNLYFELKTTNLNGEEDEYHLQMTVTEVIKNTDN